MQVYACLQFIHIKHNTKYTQNERKGAFHNFPVTYLGRREQTGSFCVAAGIHMLALGHYILILHGRVIIIVSYLPYEGYIPSYTLSRTCF